jgi:hypothetical protein
MTRSISNERSNKCVPTVVVKIGLKDREEKDATDQQNAGTTLQNSAFLYHECLGDLSHKKNTVKYS